VKREVSWMPHVPVGAKKGEIKNREYKADLMSEGNILSEEKSVL
jgi:hypothetical protein